MKPALAILEELPLARGLWQVAQRLAPLPSDAEDIFQDMLVDSVKQERYLTRTNRPVRFLVQHCRRRAVQRLFKYGEDCLDVRQREVRATPTVDQEPSQWLDDYFFQTTSAEADSNMNLLWFVDELVKQLTSFETDVLLMAWEWAQTVRPRYEYWRGNSNATVGR